jgi:aryl-alcohol dehydrogenase-like predicted oxidoreductase
LEYRQLGRSGLRVSALCMGTMTFGGRGVFSAVGTVDLNAARRHIDLCLDAGVNLIDTADIYSGGLSEKIVGEALAGRRNRVLLATKARFPMGDGPNDAGASRHHLISACEASLRRLNTDHVDLYQVHEWDGQTPVEEIVAALDSLVHAGKVRYLGISNFSGWHITKVLDACERQGAAPIVSQQIHYTLQAREAEYELLPITIDHGLGVMVWSPLAGGLLSGKYRRGQQHPAGGRYLSDWGEPPIREPEKAFDIIEVLVAIAEARGVSAAQVALAWTLGRPGITTLIVGARTEAQFTDNLKAAELKLTAEERARLDEVSQPPLLYPYWHQAKTANDRLSPADLLLLGPYLKA